MARGTAKSPEAFRTISEAADALDLPQHVLRFWETRFSQIKPMKRSGGRRYYRPGDIALLRGIRHLLYDEGYTIKGVQRILRERGIGHVAGLAEPVAVQEVRPPEAAAVTPNGQIPSAPPAGIGHTAANPVGHPTLPAPAPARADPVRAALSRQQPQHSVPEAAPMQQGPAEPSHSAPVATNGTISVDHPAAAPSPAQPIAPSGSGLRFVPEPQEPELSPEPSVQHAPPPAAWSQPAVPTPSTAPIEPSAPPLAMAPLGPETVALAPGQSAQPTPIVPALSDDQRRVLTDALQTLEACKAHLDQVRGGLKGNSQQ